MRAFILLIGLALISTSWAGKKTPDEEALAAKQFSEHLRREAEYLTTLFEESGTPMPALVKRYIDLTEQEAELVAKSAESWGGNQPRRAQLQREKAQSICNRRGIMSEEVHSLAKKIKAEWMGDKEENWGSAGGKGEKVNIAPKDKNSLSKMPPQKSPDKESPVVQDSVKSDVEKSGASPKEEPSEASVDLAKVESRLREIEEKEAALAREKRQLMDQFREKAAQ